MFDLEELLKKALTGETASFEEALFLADSSVDIYDLMHAANSIREKFFGNKVSFCSVINARSGRCANDCAFCAQSTHHNTGADVTETVAPEKALSFSRKAASNGAANFGLVTSGVKLHDKDFQRIVEAAKMISEEGKILPCVSLGELVEAKTVALYNAGIRRYHHNLETSEQFYLKICSTYDYRKKIRTLHAAKEAGLEICCGGIFGLGESWEDRVNMAITIREIDVSSVPLNFLRPIEGTPLGDMPPLVPLEALRIISVYRFILPEKTIKVCGGREFVLRDLQSMMFYAGANGAMLGNYLTTSGREAEQDVQMLADLGLEFDTGGTT